MSKRRSENQDKVILTETLKTFRCAKLIGLESRRTFLPWQTKYTQLKLTLKSCGLPDWKSQLLILGKDSLKIQHDQESCMFMTELSEFEQYILSTYIHGLNMVEDLLSKLFEMGKPNNTSDSMRAITEALNAFKKIKSKTI